MPSIGQWDAMWRALDLPATPALRARYEDLLVRYSEPHRKYHTLRHLDECLARFEELRAEAEHPAEVEVALWFHDAIHAPRASDNEARSAELAAATVVAAGGSAECAGRIAALVMATRHAALPAGADAGVLVDVDLAILGAPAARFEEYERQVRAEYAWVPEGVYRRERRKILEAFLARPHIFSTPRFQARYEAPARANICGSLARCGL